jgi:hypothetical protein
MVNLKVSRDGKTSFIYLMPHTNNIGPQEGITGVKYVYLFRSILLTVALFSVGQNLSTSLCKVSSKVIFFHGNFSLAMLPSLLPHTFLTWHIATQFGLHGVSRCLPSERKGKWCRPASQLRNRNRLQNTFFLKQVGHFTLMKLNNEEQNKTTEQ